MSVSPSDFISYHKRLFSRAFGLDHEAKPSRRCLREGCKSIQPFLIPGGDFIGTHVIRTKHISVSASGSILYHKRLFGRAFGLDNEAKSVRRSLREECSSISTFSNTRWEPQPFLTSKAGGNDCVIFCRLFVRARSMNGHRIKA